MITVLNFSHPLTPEQIEQLRGILGDEIRVIDVPFQIDLGQSIASQVEAIIDGIGLGPAEFQGTPIVVNLPGLTPGAAVVLAELHGRMGYFPPIVALRREGTPPRFVVAEVINLQEVRDRARTRR